MLVRGLFAFYTRSSVRFFRTSGKIFHLMDKTPEVWHILRKGVFSMIRILLSTRLGERRMTQKELALKTGIRAATISVLYNENVERVSLDQLEKICDVLDCEVGDLLKREHKDHNKKHG